MNTSSTKPFASMELSVRKEKSTIRRICEYFGLGLTIEEKRLRAIEKAERRRRANIDAYKKLIYKSIRKDYAAGSFSGSYKIGHHGTGSLRYEIVCAALEEMTNDGFPFVINNVKGHSYFSVLCNIQEAFNYMKEQGI